MDSLHCCLAFIVVLLFAVIIFRNDKGVKRSNHEPMDFKQYTKMKKRW